MKDSLQILLHGVGYSELVFTDGSVLPIDKSQDIEIKVDATTAEIEGGDGFYALLQYITKKTGTVDITNATMSLADLKAITGDDVTSAAERLISNEAHTVAAGAFQLAKTANVVVDSVKVTNASGVPLTRLTSDPGASGPTVGQFYVTDAGAVKVSTDLNSTEVTSSYYYTDSTGLAIHSLEDSVPGNCEVRHRIITDEMDDGKRYELNIRVYKAKAKGSYDYTAKKGAAFAPKLSFTILDAGRADKRTLSYSVSEYTA